jgi:hypothetical protein
VSQEKSEFAAAKNSEKDIFIMGHGTRIYSFFLPAGQLLPLPSPFRRLLPSFFSCF